MKHVILSSVVAILSLCVLTSCSGTEDVALKFPYLSMLGNTDCHGSIDRSRVDRGNGSFEMILDGTTAKCKFVSLDYPCDFGKVNVNVIYNEGILAIVEYPSSDIADCRCETDASFYILNMPEEDFILKIYRGDTFGNFNEEFPRYTGRFSIEKGIISIPY